MAPAMSGVVTVQPVRGIYTAASQVRGGVTTGTTYGRMNAPRRAKMEGDPLPTPGEDDPTLPNCGCHWVDNGDGTYTCSICGYTWDELDECCHCQEEENGGYCWCPIGDGWQVWLFMAMLAAGYGCFVIRRREKVVKSEE